MYSKQLIDHFENPRNSGNLEYPSANVVVSNPACGDTLQLSVRVTDEQVAEVRYLVRGCTASIAAGSALTELLAGRCRAEVAQVTAAMVEEALGGLPAESRHAAALCAAAVKELVKRLAAVC
jgi:nitrogen fixation protein NifU and related proteins